jgi:hypothetical protein
LRLLQDEPVEVSWLIASVGRLLEVSEKEHLGGPTTRAKARRPPWPSTEVQVSSARPRGRAHCAIRSASRRGLPVEERKSLHLEEESCPVAVSYLPDTISGVRVVASSVASAIAATVAPTGGGGFLSHVSEDRSRAPEAGDGAGSCAAPGTFSCNISSRLRSSLSAMVAVGSVWEMGRCVVRC